MRTVRFGLPEGFSADLAAGLPVRILDHRMQLVGQTTAARGARLKAGAYWAETFLPNGESVRSDFEVRGRSQKSPMTVDLVGPPAFAEIALEAADPGLVFEAVRPPAAAPPVARRSAAATVAPLGLKLRLVDGSGEHADVAARLRAGAMPLPFGGAILQVAAPGSPIRNIRVPVSGAAIALEFHAAPWGGPFPHIRLADARAELLLRYAVSQEASEFAQLAEEAGGLAEEALASGGPGLLLGALGGFALLRVGELDRLGDIPEKLAARQPDWPDLQVLAAELAARRGRHETARSRFLAIAAAASPPVFRITLRFLLDRLESYRSEGAPDLDLGAALAAVGPLASRVDFSRPLLTFASRLAGSAGPSPLSGAQVDALEGWANG